MTPYRDAATPTCPRCKAPLARVTQTDDDLQCDRGCGEFLSDATLRKTVRLELVDWRTHERARWGLDRPKCLVCSTEMVSRDIRQFRCAEHGLWFDKQGAADFKEQIAPAVKLTNAARALAQQAVEGDLASLEHLFLRVATAELRIANLVEQLDALARRVR
jgi:hypothetical protein